MTDNIIYEITYVKKMDHIQYEYDISILSTNEFKKITTGLNKILKPDASAAAGQAPATKQGAENAKETDNNSEFNLHKMDPVVDGGGGHAGAKQAKGQAATKQGQAAPKAKGAATKQEQRQGPAGALLAEADVARKLIAEAITNAQLAVNSIRLVNEHLQSDEKYALPEAIRATDRMSDAADTMRDAVNEVSIVAVKKVLARARSTTDEASVSILNVKNDIISEDVSKDEAESADTTARLALESLQSADIAMEAIDDTAVELMARVAVETSAETTPAEILYSLPAKNILEVMMLMKKNNIPLNNKNNNKKGGGLEDLDDLDESNLEDIELNYIPDNFTKKMDKDYSIFDLDESSESSDNDSDLDFTDI